MFKRPFNRGIFAAVLAGGVGSADVATADWKYIPLQGEDQPDGTPCTVTQISRDDGSQVYYPGQIMHGPQTGQLLCAADVSEDPPPPEPSYPYTDPQLGNIAQPYGPFGGNWHRPYNSQQNVIINNNVTVHRGASGAPASGERTSHHAIGSRLKAAPAVVTPGHKN